MTLVVLMLTGILFSLTMLMVSVALVMAVIVTNIFLRKDSGKRVPSSVRHVFLHHRHRPRLAWLPSRLLVTQTDILTTSSHLAAFTLERQTDRQTGRQTTSPCLAAFMSRIQTDRLTD